MMKDLKMDDRLKAVTVHCALIITHMRKKLTLLVIGTISIISIIIIVWSADDFSSEYNSVSAKMDIKNGDIKIINVGIPKDTFKVREIERIAAKYGFKNVYIEKYSFDNSEKGINNYNKLMEGYLTVRNGINWRQNYQNEIDSLYKVGSAVNITTQIYSRQLLAI